MPRGDLDVQHLFAGRPAARGVDGVLPVARVDLELVGPARQVDGPVADGEVHLRGQLAVAGAGGQRQHVGPALVGPQPLPQRVRVLGRVQLHGGDGGDGAHGGGPVALVGDAHLHGYDRELEGEQRPVVALLLPCALLLERGGDGGGGGCAYPAAGGGGWSSIERVYSRAIAFSDRRCSVPLESSLPTSSLCTVSSSIRTGLL